MQSGISASQDLVEHFNKLLANDNYFGLLVTIQNEALTPLDLLSSSSSSSSFGDNVDALVVPRLEPKQPLYAILRRHDTAPHLIAATYVPDAAPVRQKMLFASSRLTLVRELGSEHFRDTLFATTPDELSSAGFTKHAAHEALDAPLTEEERTLGAVKRAEQEAGRGTATREIHLSKSLKMPVQPAAVDALKELNNGRTLVMLKINADSETVELVPDNSSPSSIDDLVKIISPTEPRFTFFRYAHTHNGVDSTPLLFIYTCPATPGTKAIKFRMLYPLMKRAVLDVASSEAKLSVDHKIEVDEPTELTEAGVNSDLHPQVAVRKGFSRPKRPGR